MRGEAVANGPCSLHSDAQMLETNVSPPKWSETLQTDPSDERSQFTLEPINRPEPVYLEMTTILCS